MYYFLTAILLSVTTVSSNLIDLQKKYSWPEQKPNYPANPHSFFLNYSQLKSVLNTDIKLIVELGSWLGTSTRFILDNAPQAVVIAIDHWKGSTEHFTMPYVAPFLPILYETFLVNCWQYQDRLIPMKTTTLLGLQEISDFNLTPDLVYVDASHDYDSVTSDLEKTYSLFPNTIICGDDWLYEPVQKAVNDFAARNRFVIYYDNNFWIYKK